MQTNSIYKFLLQTSAIVAVGLGTSYAQDDTELLNNPPVEEAESADEIVVTGSRIRQSTFSSPVAMDVLTVEDAKIEGIADLGGLLQTSVAASGSSQITSSTSAAFVQNGGLGSESIGLRGLNANRTLDLINGRRAGPSGIRGSIDSFDINSIPLAGVSRVDILKDGASSIYGSDAIAGVINYITNKEDGGEIDVFTSIAEDGGGEQFRVSGSYGKSFDNKNNTTRFRVTGDYFKEKELARGDRAYLDCDEAYVFNNDGSRADVIDPRTGEFQCRDLLWGQVWVYDYNGSNVPDTFPYLAQFDYDGSLASNGLPGYPDTGPGGLRAPAGFFPIYYNQADLDALPAYGGVQVGDRARGLVNYDHPFQDEETLTPDVERITLMADGDIEFSNGIKLYTEALFNRRVTKDNGYRQYWSYIYGEDAIFAGVPGANQTPTAQGWSGDQWFSPTAITDISDEKVTIEYFRLVAGLTGEFGGDGYFSDWAWDVYAQHSDSHGEYEEDQIYDDSITPYNFQLDSCQNIDFGNGAGITAGASGNGIFVAGRPCVDVPWFSPELLRGNISDEVRDFLFFDAKGETDFTQSTVEGYVTGKLITLPAGEVGVAAGLFYQRDEIRDTPDEQILASNVWGASSAGITAGYQDSKAVYGEIRVPLLKDKPFAEELTVIGSARQTWIETFRPDGVSAKTDGFNYRGTLNWQVVPALRLRGSYGTSYRAPGLFEQFLGNETSFQNLRGVDPCINVQDSLDTGTINQRTYDNCLADFASLGADLTNPDESTAFGGGAITTDVFRGGGFGILEPETSTNYTIGGVFSPDFADLSIAVDYFDITVKNEIGTLTPGAILSGCYNAVDFPSNPLCNLFTRNPAGTDGLRLAELTATFININEQVNTGLDFTLRYGHETKWGDFTLNAQASHQLEQKQLLLNDGSFIDFNGDIGEPKTTGFANLTFEPDDKWTFRYSLDYIGKTNNEADDESGTTGFLYGTPIIEKNRTESVIYHGLSAGFDAGSGWAIRAGVNNIFDEHPPAVTAADSGNSPIVSQYDYLGRRGFLNVTKKFD